MTFFHSSASIQTQLSYIRAAIFFSITWSIEGSNIAQLEYSCTINESNVLLALDQWVYTYFLMNIPCNLIYFYLYTFYIKIP